MTKKPKPRAYDDKGRLTAIDIKVAPAIWDAFREAASAAGESATDRINRLIQAEVSDPPLPQMSPTKRAAFDLALRQHKRKLDLEFEERARQRGREYAEEFALPSHFRRIEEANRIVKSRRGALKAADYNKLRKCLHSDTLAGIRERAKRGEPEDAAIARLFDEAFQMITENKLVLLSEKQHPTDAIKIPRTPEDWAAARQAATDARKAARNHATAQRANSRRPTLAS